MIKDRDAIFEVTALDLALHTAAGVTAYQRLAVEMQALFRNARRYPRAGRGGSNYILQIPLSCFYRPL